MPRRLYRVRMNLDVVVYADTNIQEYEEVRDSYVADVLRQHAKEQTFSYDNIRVTQLKSTKSLPEGWDDGCIPYGKDTQRPISKIQKRIKEGKEE